LVFAKVVHKTTSGSGFYFIFEFRIPDLIEKDINVEEVSVCPPIWAHWRHLANMIEIVFTGANW